MSIDKPDYYNDLDKIYLKIWGLLNQGLKNRNDPLHIPSFICGEGKSFDARVVVLRGVDKEEKKFGLMAKEFVKKFVKGDSIILRTKKYDAKGKFGRILGDIIVDKVSMSETMIKEHHAVPYYGQSKETIAESHLKNREFIKIV